MKKLALSGMLVTRDKMESMGKQLGISTKNSVTEIVSERERNHLQQVVEERAKAMNAIFQRIATDVKIVSDATANILANPNLYPQQELRYSQSIEEGWAVSLAVDPSAVDNLENLRGRIALAANIQDVLKSMVLAYDVNCSMYTAFEDGFDIVFDTTESDMKAHYFDNPNPYRIFNFLDRPWYKNAKEKQEIVFTDALLNVNSLAASAFVACSGPIMVNGNFVGVTGFGFESEDIEKIVFQTKVGETGFGFILNRNGQVILSPNLAISIDERTDEFVDEAENLSARLLPFTIGALILLIALVSFLSERLGNSFAQPIQKLTDGVREISSGNFDKKIEINTGDEIEQLADSFNVMTDEIKNYMANLEKVTAAEERIATELKVATNIQLSALPHDFPNHDAFEIYATMNAAKFICTLTA